VSRWLTKTIISIPSPYVNTFFHFFQSFFRREVSRQSLSRIRGEKGAEDGGLSAIRKATELKIFFILNALTGKAKTRCAQTVDFSSPCSWMIKNIFLTFRAYAPVQ